MGSVLEVMGGREKAAVRVQSPNWSGQDVAFSAGQVNTLEGSHV